MSPLRPEFLLIIAEFKAIWLVSVFKKQDRSFFKSQKEIGLLRGLWPKAQSLDGLEKFILFIADTASC